MSRNFGIGSRDMYRAAMMILNAASIRKDISFGTARTLAERFRHFVDYAKQRGIGRMEHITRELLVRYGQELAWEVEEGLTRASYAQNLVSSVNTVLALATRGEWKSVSPTKDCDIPRRCAVRTVPLPLPEQAKHAIQSVLDAGYERATCIALLAFHLGLRCLEGSLLDCSKALHQAQCSGEVTIIRGTKGGRKRTVKVRNEDQIEALTQAVKVQGKGTCLIPIDSNWIQFKRREILLGIEVLKSHYIGGYRELRSLYAATRYTEETGYPPPCNSTSRADKAIDLSAREKISNELGHGRPQILGAYIGGRK